MCVASGEKYVNEFTVIKGVGKYLCRKNTAEKLKLLQIGLADKVQFCLDAAEGSDADM